MRAEDGKVVDRGRLATTTGIATGVAPLALLALAEMLAFAPARDLAAPRLWVLWGGVALVLGLTAALLGGAAGAGARALGARSFSTTEAIGAVVAVLVGTAYLGSPLVSRLPGALTPERGPQAAAVAALFMFALYAPLRLLLARFSVPLGAVLALVVALAAIEASTLAAIRGARLAERLVELRPAIYAAAIFFAAAAAAAVFGLGRLRYAGGASAVGGALLATRVLLPNAHEWIGTFDDGARPQVGPPVIFVVLDTLRADALDLDDPSTSKTPHLARLAARGAGHAGIANASWTLPGHASLFTGLRLSRHRTDETAEPGFSGALASGTPIVHELFAQSGYRTVCVAANGIVGPGSGLVRGCRAYVNPGRVWMRNLLPRRLAELGLPSASLDPILLVLAGVGGNATAREVVDLGLTAMEDSPHSLYLFMNFLDAHGPYVPRDGLVSVSEHDRRALFDAYLQRMLGRTSTTELARDHNAILRACYDAQVRELDAELGRFLDALEARGWLDPAVVLVTSDHGEAFDENPDLEGYFGHHSAIEPAVRIPLVLKRAGQRERAASARSFQQVDVLPTLLEAAGLPPVPQLDGVSLAQPRSGPLLTEWYERANPGSFPYFPGNRAAVYEGHLKYVREGGRGERLYDLGASPYEGADVAAAHPEAVERLRKALDHAVEPAGPTPAPLPADPARLEQLRALGYLE